MAGNVTSLFRSNAAHSPSMAALARESDGVGPVDFCIPCNPYFPTAGMMDELSHRFKEIITYYPSSADTITAELCNLLQLPPSCVAMGNGSTELITWIDHLLVRESLAIPVPTFGRWTDQPNETGKRVDMFPLPEGSGFALDPAAYAEFIRARGTRVAVICNPNNPDGGFLPKQTVLAFCDALADLDLVVIDESFLEFADAESEASIVQDAILRPNVIVLRSLGKNFGLHGIRFGYMVANPALAGRVRAMLPKWNLNAMAEHVVFMLKNHMAEYQESLHMVRRDRLDMARQLSALPGLTIYPSQGNFLFVRLPVGAEGTTVRDQLLTGHRILVRECGNKIGSSSRFLRLVVRPQTDVRRLVSGLEQVLYGNANSNAGREAAAVPELGRGTYSSGTAAVDRLVSATNGGGMPGLAQQAQALPQGAVAMQSQQQPMQMLGAQTPAGMNTHGQAMGAAQAPGMTAQAQAQAMEMLQQQHQQQMQQQQMQQQQHQQQQQQPVQGVPITPGQPQSPSLGRGLTAAQVRGMTQPPLQPPLQPQPQPLPQPLNWPAAGASRAG